MSDAFAQSFYPIRTIHLCGRMAPIEGFARTISARLQQRRAGISLRPPTDRDCVALQVTQRIEGPWPTAEPVGWTTLEAMRNKVAASSYALTVLDADGQVICMFGVAASGLLSSDGSPWLYCSDLVDVHRRLIARLSAKYLAAMLEFYPRLSGWIDACDVVSIRWLEWLGFEVGEEISYGRAGALFRPFEMKRADV